MNINGTQVINFIHSRDRFGAVQEVFGGSVLRVGTNEAQVTIVSGGGQLEISDFAIHFKVNI